MTRVTSPIEFETLLPDAQFGEFHSRVIEAPIDEVWQAFHEVTAPEVRLLKPLFALRALPAILRGRRGPVHGGPSGPLLDAFENEGFVMLRRDAEPVAGRASVLFGAAGRFWSPAHNAPMAFDSAEDFLGHDDPTVAKTVARFDAIAEGPHRTRLETETVIEAADPRGRRKFAAYWAVIRGPSGLLRRSWLAAVDRRATR